MRPFAPEIVGQADLVLLDSTNLIVGPTSEVLLDKFVYDRTGSSGSVVLQATRGVFRFVAGSQDHGAYHVNTPYGLLGVSESLAKFVEDIPGEVISPPRTSTSLSLAEENDFRGTTNASGGTEVEVVVKPKGQKRGLCLNGRPPEYGKPCEVECDVVVRLVKGKGATYTSSKGERRELKNVNDVICDQGGHLVSSSSTESILSFEVAEVIQNETTTPTDAWHSTYLHTHHEHALPIGRVCPGTQAGPYCRTRGAAKSRRDFRLSTCKTKASFLMFWYSVAPPERL